MLYRFFTRILRRQMFFHLIIPLLCGFLVEGFYSSHINSHINKDEGSTFWLQHGHHVALLLGIVVAYLVVIAIQVWRETTIGLQQMELNQLAERLQGAKSLFAVGTIKFSEWFDPAVQVYLATISEQKLLSMRPGGPFKYERVLLIPNRSAHKDLSTDYIDGYYAKCLIQIHQRLRTELYSLQWPQIEKILHGLTKPEKIAIGYYPKFFKRISHKNARRLIWIVRRRRVRHMAVGLIESSNGSPEVFLYSKHRAIVQLHFVRPGRTHSWEKLVSLIKEELFDAGTGEVHGQYNFMQFFSPALHHD